MATAIHPFLLVFRSHMPSVFSIFFTKRFLRFCTVGASGVFVNLGVLAILNLLGVHAILASALAIEVSILSNFAANEFWTFKDRGVRSKRLSRLWQFQAVSLVGALVQLSVFVLCTFCWALMTNQIGGIDPGTDQSWYDTLVQFVQAPPNVGIALYMAQLAGIGLATAWNFCANLFWTWQSNDDVAAPSNDSESSVSGSELE